MLLVFGGGAVGASARYLVSQALSAGRFPLATFLVNISGAFALGALLEALGRRGPDAGVRRATRLALGTGLLGAFTTYSTLAVEVTVLTRDEHPGLALVYGFGSVVAGLAAAAAGVAAARLLVPAVS